MSSRRQPSNLLRIDKQMISGGPMPPEPTSPDAVVAFLKSLDQAVGACAAQLVDQGVDELLVWASFRAALETLHRCTGEVERPAAPPLPGRAKQAVGGRRTATKVTAA